MAPAAGAKESRSRRARAELARGEACARIERGAEGRDEVPPRSPHEAPRESGRLAARQRGVERSMSAIDAGPLDVPDPEDVADAVRRVDEAPGADPDRAG